MRFIKTISIAALCAGAFAIPATAQTAADCTKFVSAATGKGKTASLEKPAKDLGNIISRLEPGDVI